MQIYVMTKKLLLPKKTSHQQRTLLSLIQNKAIFLWFIVPLYHTRQCHHITICFLISDLTNSDNQVLLWDEQACLNYSTSAIEFSPPDAVKVNDEGSPQLLVDNTIPKRYIFHMIVIFWGQFHHNYYSKHQKLPTKWWGLRNWATPKIN